MPMEVKILTKTVKADMEELMSFALMSSKDHAVTSAEMNKTCAGMSANQRNSTRKFKTFAAAQSMDLWLYTQVNGHRVIGYDLVPVETSKVKAQTFRDGKHLL